MIRLFARPWDLVFHRKRHSITINRKVININLSANVAINKLIVKLMILIFTSTWVTNLAQCPAPGSIGGGSGTFTSNATVTLSATTVGLLQSDIDTHKISHVWSGGSGSVSQISNSGGSWSSTYTVNPSSTTTYTVTTVCNGVSSNAKSVTVNVSGGGNTGGGNTGGGNNGDGTTGGGTSTPSPLPTIGYNGSPCNGKELLFYFNTNGNTTCSAPVWVFSSGGAATSVPGNPNQIKITWPASSNVSYVSVSVFSTCNGIYKEYRYPADGSNMVLDVSRSPTVLLAATTNPSPMCEANVGAIYFSSNASGLPLNFNASYNYYIDDVLVGSAPSSTAVTLFTYNTNSNIVPLLSNVHTAKTVMSFTDLPCLIGPGSSVATSQFNVLNKVNYDISISGPNEIHSNDEITKDEIIEYEYTAAVTSRVGPVGQLRYEWFVDGIQIFEPTIGRSSAILPVRYGSEVFCKLYSDNSCEESPAISNSIIILYPPNNYNWIKETSVLVKDTKTDDDFDMLNISDGRKSLTWTYFDGLERPIQTISVQSSPSKKDHVQPIVYEKLGRSNITYLPYTSGDNGYFKSDFIGRENESYSNATSPQYQFYQNALNVGTDSKPYSETAFEPSPLNRVLKQGAPGLSWQPNADIYSMSDNTVKKRYEFNLNNEVLRLNYDETTGIISVSPIASEKYYAINQLYANKTYDESNNEVIEYVNKEGLTVCKKVFVKTENNVKKYATTYYLYDVFNSLVAVIPPEGVDLLEN